MLLETTQLVEDDDDNLVAYNPFYDSSVKSGEIGGNDKIHIGEDLIYKIQYDEEVNFELDFDYGFCKITNANNKECTISVDLDFDIIGEVITLIAKNKNGETIDIKNITIRGLGAS